MPAAATPFGEIKHSSFRLVSGKAHAPGAGNATTFLPAAAGAILQYGSACFGLTSCR
jgi:hypothetical protein